MRYYHFPYTSSFAINQSQFNKEENQMKKQLLLALLILFISTNTIAKNLTITSFNIRFYGFGGEYSGSLTDEFRDDWLSEYMKKNNIMSDVIVFQEIIDKNRLRKLLANNYNCISYKNDQKNHLHVVICYRYKTFIFDKVAGDDNHIIDNSSLERYRPAVYGILKNRDAKPLLRIVGVHLKARETHFKTRKKQAKIIKKNLQTLDSSVPTIIIGDFNLHSEKEVNDISEIFKDLGLKHVDNNRFTYMSPTFEGILDHVWLSESLSHKELIVKGPKTKDFNDTKRFDNLYFYNKFISDHAPIIISIKLEI